MEPKKINWKSFWSKAGKVLVPAKYGSVGLASESVIKCSIEEYGTDDNVLYDLRGYLYPIEIYPKLQTNLQDNMKSICAND